MLNSGWLSILRGHLQSGLNLEAALALMRRDGATITECVVSVRSVLGCEVIDAKRTVTNSRAWADVAERTSADLERELGVEQKLRTKPGEVTVSFEYSRHVGPRFVHGAVTLQFGRGNGFEFRSEATWPQEHYTAAIDRAVRDVLSELGALDSTTCALQSVGWDEVASCEAGFAAAARAATRAAFEV
jgi:hypothetical protein